MQCNLPRTQVSVLPRTAVLKCIVELRGTFCGLTTITVRAFIYTYHTQVFWMCARLLRLSDVCFSADSLSAVSLLNWSFRKPALLPTANPGSLFIVWTISLPCTKKRFDLRFENFNLRKCSVYLGCKQTNKSLNLVQHHPVGVNLCVSLRI